MYLVRGSTQVPLSAFSKTTQHSKTSTSSYTFLALEQMATAPASHDVSIASARKCRFDVQLQPGGCCHPALGIRRSGTEVLHLHVHNDPSLLRSCSKGTAQACC